MNYSSLSTRSLEKILGRSAADSAEERAVREELRRRATERPKAMRRRTPVLFDSRVWGEICSGSRVGCNRAGDTPATTAEKENTR